jgi:hypothetical protein
LDVVVAVDMKKKTHYCKFQLCREEGCLPWAKNCAHNKNPFCREPSKKLTANTQRTEKTDSPRAAHDKIPLCREPKTAHDKMLLCCERVSQLQLTAKCYFAVSGLQQRSILPWASFMAHGKMSFA